MSTKIYAAYVLRDRRQLWSVCRKIRERCEREVRATLSGLYCSLINLATHAQGKPDDPFVRHRAPDGSFDAMDASRFVRDAYGQQLCRSERDEFDCTVCVAIRQARDGQILLIPYPGSGQLSRSLDFLARMPEVHDYHYQNAGDRPREVSAREWAARRRTWDPLLADGEWRHMLVLDLVSYNGWRDICPAIEMTRREQRRRGRRRHGEAPR